MKTIISNIFNAVYNNLISGGAYYLIIKGILVTFLITVTAWIVAALIGIAVSYLMCYEKKVVSVIGRCMCFVFRSVPAILTLWLFYYCFFGKSSINPILISGVALGFFGAGHLSEIISRSVKKEQEELSANMKGRLEKVYFSTVIPQAAEDSLFSLKRLCVNLLQWSSVVGYIAVNDLTEVMYGIGQRTMYPFFSIFFAAICYILATILIEAVFSFVSKKIFGKDNS